jgi:hypothetical protein
MSQRNSRFRPGDIAESLGTVLLQGAALVAPVPRSEDVGLDVVATLLKKVDSYNVAAENSFYVQLKSKSVRSFEFTGPAVNWVLSLELPLFVGSVDTANSRIDLFVCHRLTQAIIEGHEYQTIVVDLDSQNELDGPKDGRKLCVGPAVHSWTVSEMADASFVEKTYSILKPHLEAARRNLELGRCKRFEQLAWKTGEVPELANIKMMGGPDSLQTAMNLMMPYLSACLLELNGTGHLGLFDKLRGVAADMCDLGATPDPILEEIGKLRDRKRQ